MEMMGSVNCLYCGKAVSDQEATCPACGAPSHFQQRGFRLGARQRFILYFAILAICSLLIALILPR